jgi:hypothetical protein
VFVAVIRQYAVPPGGKAVNGPHGPTPPDPQSAGFTDVQTSFTTIIAGTHAVPTVTWNVTVFEVTGGNAPVTAVAEFDTAVIAQSDPTVVLKHTCGGSPLNVTTTWG